MKENYYSFNSYLKKCFNTKVHKISLNAGFTCPNKDGTLSYEGCIFCNESGFSRFSAGGASIEHQIETSFNFLKNRFGARKFIAYFQNATNTNASITELRNAYDVIKKYPEIVGLSIATRPDCIDEEKLGLIEGYASDYDVWIEYGVQTIHDRTLQSIKRSHRFSDSLQAIKATARRNIKVGIHVILGLPGETYDDMMQTAHTLAYLPVSGIKFHVLHILKGTQLAHLYAEERINLLSRTEYIELVCDFLEVIDPECVILRLISDANDKILVAPSWINRKQDIINAIKKELEIRGSCQGGRYEEKKNMYIR